METEGRFADAPRIPTTRWTLLRRAADNDTEVRLPALDELLRLYRPVMLAQVSAFMKIPHHDAEDIVQAFITAKILEQSPLLKRANPGKGRFRNFLMTTLRRFVVSQLRKRQARKRAPDSGHRVSFDECPDLVSYEQQFDHAFNREWVHHVLMQALSAMEDECRRRDRLDVWDCFRLRVVEPTMDGTTPPGYAELVKKLGIVSPTKARNFLVTAKRMYRRHLAAVVRATLASEDDVERELAELKALLDLTGTQG